MSKTCVRSRRSHREYATGSRSSAPIPSEPGTLVSKLDVLRHSFCGHKTIFKNVLRLAGFQLKLRLNGEFRCRVQ